MINRETNMIPVGIGEITIVDMNDFEASDVAPENPKRGTVWLDMSVTPPVFRVWDGEKWVTENDWQDAIKDYEDSINEAIAKAEQAIAEVELLQGEVSLKASTDYVDRIKKELTLGGKNVMPYTYPLRENIETFWTTSNNNIGRFTTITYNSALKENPDYFINGQKVFKFAVDPMLAGQQNIEYVSANVIDEKKIIQLKANTKYTFSAWALKNNSCKAFRFLIMNSTTDSVHATSSLLTPEDDIFKRYSLTFTTDDTTDYYFVMQNHPKRNVSIESNVLTHYMIIEKGDATDTWSPCIDDVGSSSIVYLEETLKHLKSNLKVQSDTIIANVSSIKEDVKTIDGEVVNHKKWIESAQLAIESGSIVNTVSNYLPGHENLMPYTYINIKNLHEYWQSSPKGTISKRIYDFGEEGGEDMFLEDKNVLMISCAPIDAATIEDSTLTVTVNDDIRDITLEKNTKYTISYYMYITDRIESAKCQIWNKNKNSSLSNTVEENTTVTEYTASFVKLESSFTTTDEDAIYYPKFIIKMKKDLIRDANVYIANMMIQKGSLNITWNANKEDVERYVDGIVDEQKAEINKEFEEYRNNLTGLKDYIDGCFEDGFIDEIEANSIKQHLRIIDTEKKEIDAKYMQIISNPGLKKMTNLLSPIDIKSLEPYESETGNTIKIKNVEVIESYRNGDFKIRYLVEDSEGGIEAPTDLPNFLGHIPFKVTEEITYEDLCLPTVRTGLVRKPKTTYSHSSGLIVNRSAIIAFPKTFGSIVSVTDGANISITPAYRWITKAINIPDNGEVEYVIGSSVSPQAYTNNVTVNWNLI